MAASFAYSEAASVTGSGIVASATAAEARAADRAGRAMTWADVLALTGEDR